MCIGGNLQAIDFEGGRKINHFIAYKYFNELKISNNGTLDIPIEEGNTNGRKATSMVRSLLLDQTISNNSQQTVYIILYLKV